MAELPRPRMHDVRRTIHVAIDAHQTVIDKIAEHAALAIAERDAKINALDAHNKLTGVTEP